MLLGASLTPRLLLFLVLQFVLAILHISERVMYCCQCKPRNGRDLATRLDRSSVRATVHLLKQCHVCFLCHICISLFSSPRRLIPGTFWMQAHPVFEGERRGKHQRRKSPHLSGRLASFSDSHSPSVHHLQ